MATYFSQTRLIPSGGAVNAYNLINSGNITIVSTSSTRVAFCTLSVIWLSGSGTTLIAYVNGQTFGSIAVGGASGCFLPSSSSSGVCHLFIPPSSNFVIQASIGIGGSAQFRSSIIGLELL